MSPHSIFAMALVVLATALGCGDGQRTAVPGGEDPGGDDPGGAPTVGPAADATRDRKEIAVLDPQIEARAGELSALRTRVDKLASMINVRQATNVGDPEVERREMLGLLPRIKEKETEL